MPMETVTDDDSSDTILFKDLQPTTQSKPIPKSHQLTNLPREIKLETEPHTVDLGSDADYDKIQTPDDLKTTKSPNIGKSPIPPVFLFF